jgi:hypothetical protein
MKSSLEQEDRWFSCILRASVYRPAGGAGLYDGRRFWLGGKRLKQQTGG